MTDLGNMTSSATSGNEPQASLGASKAHQAAVDEPSQAHVIPDSDICRLLKLAGIEPTEERAVAWLRDAVDLAGRAYRNSKKQPIAADYNDLVEDIAKHAKALAKRIERLRRYPACCSVVLAFRCFRPSSSGPRRVPRG